ncbi:hypothetical protein CEP51_012642 [Fusarium floridanum]|uniref:Aminoglycoside phosphotransferase domain-containing protein n=1 Tax=Fusarium floridanum TaxID=1325733 RepID=A0A428QQR2_9HYPO|nr:hypothetical protein CEP51_012642 [Fusarium floridanum]
MSTQLPSFKSAEEMEKNILLVIQHRQDAERFRHQLLAQKESIESLVKHHLGLSGNDACQVLPQESWIQGGFNICVPVEATSGGLTRRFIFRCPMSHKLAENRYPGTIDEKVGSEVATYIWMQEHCPDIRIPNLFAFGFRDGSHFTHIQQRPTYLRIYHTIWQWIYRAFRYPLLSSYSRNPTTRSLGISYMLLEYIGPETGKMLSLTWEQHLNDVDRRTRLFRGMTRIMLSLARLPHSRIGSFKFNTHDGSVSLSNRPLTSTMMIFENSGTPRTIEPFQLYQSTDRFAADMLTLHDCHLLHNPHAVWDEDDGRERMTIRALLRAVMHHFILPDQRDGPFLLQMTDLHQSNIFVDDDWNVTCLIDLEWICALPVEMVSVPYWLTNCSIDGIIGKEFEVFDQARRAFMSIMDEETKKMQFKHDIHITDTMKKVWDSKGVWFWACLRSVNAWIFVFEDHILPKFSSNERLVADLKEVSSFWREDIDSIVEEKVAEEKRYLVELQGVLDDEDIRRNVTVSR